MTKQHKHPLIKECGHAARCPVCGTGNKRSGKWQPLERTAHPVTLDPVYVTNPAAQTGKRSMLVAKEGGKPFEPCAAYVSAVERAAANAAGAGSTTSTSTDTVVDNRTKLLSLLTASSAYFVYAHHDCLASAVRRADMPPTE